MLYEWPPQLMNLQIYQMTARQEAESWVRSWGFSHVFTWIDGPYVSLSASIPPSHILPSPHPPTKLIVLISNAHYSLHSHRGLTTHLVLRGALTIAFPNDPNLGKNTYGVGDRIDVEAGSMHEVWMGDDGCEYVIGE